MPIVINTKAAVWFGGGVQAGLKVKGSSGVPVRDGSGWFGLD